MRSFIVVGFCLMPFFAEAQIFKCTETDGRVSFSYAPCKAAGGTSEYVEVQTNELGTFATPEQIEQQRLNNVADAPRSRQKITVVTDSATEDQSTLDGIVNKRLRLKEEALERQQGSNAGGVTVVKDSGSESQMDKAYRLKRASAELNRGSASATLEHADSEFSEVNTREVPYVAGQSENERHLQQLENKMNDPRPADSSTSACVDSKPSRGVVIVRGEEIWPGMPGHQDRRLIGSPDSLNSVIVGQEQWAYRVQGGGTTYLRISGRCVSSIE